MRESVVERRLSEKVKSLGGLSIKLMPIVAGVPDRLVLLSDGRHYLIELKTVNGRVRPAQRVWHSRAEELGHPVVVLHGVDQVDEWISSLKTGVE